MNDIPSHEGAYITAGQIKFEGVNKVSYSPLAYDLTRPGSLVDFSKTLPTTEETAADYKQRITAHLEDVKRIMDVAIADGFNVSFNVGDVVTVTLSKTF